MDVITEPPRSALVVTPHPDDAEGGCGATMAKWVREAGGYAAKTRFKHLVVQGGITTGLLHALVAMDMPGPGTVFLNQNWQFTAPVFIGDTITAEAEVLEMHATKPVTKLKMTVTRQTGEKALEGEAWCYTFAPED